MTWRKLIYKIARLMLESEVGTRDWVKEPSLLRCWYCFCGLVLASFFVTLLFRITPLCSWATRSIYATAAFRWIMFSIMMALIICVFIFTYQYFKYVLVERHKFMLQNVLFFYIISVVVFAMEYYFLYLISPSLFLYSNPPVAVVETLRPITLGTYLIKCDFLLFSAFHTVTGTYFKISPNSIWVSLMSYIQSLYTLALVALLVAAYVNRRFRHSKSRDPGS